MDQVIAGWDFVKHGREASMTKGCCKLSPGLRARVHMSYDHM